MAEESGVDIARLGLELDAREFARQGEASTLVLREIDEASQATTRATQELTRELQSAAQASANRAGQAQREVDELERAQASVDAAFANYLESRARREQEEAAQAAQTAAQRGAGRARAEVQALEAEYRRLGARIKEEQARGLLTPQEARAAGRQIAEEYNQAVLQVLDQANRSRSLQGAAGAQVFTEIAGSLKNVDDASRTAGVGMGRVQQSLVSLLRQVTGTNPAVAQLANLLGSMALGGGLMVAALAGIAAVSAGWRKWSEDAREAEQAARKAADALLELSRQERESAGAVALEMVQASERELDRVRRMLETLERGGGPMGVGAFGDAAQRHRDRIEELAEAIEGGYRRVERIEEEALRGQQQRQASSLASLIAHNNATGAERDRAAQLLQEATAALARIEADGSEEALQRRTQLLGVIQTLTGAYDSQRQTLEREAAAARRAAQEAQQAVEARRRALLQAIDLRVAERTEIQEVAARLREIRDLEAAGIADLETRVRLRREERDILETLTRRIGTPTGGLARTPNLQGADGTQFSTNRFRQAVPEMQEVEARLAGVRRYEEALRRLTDQQNTWGARLERSLPALQASAEGLLALDRSLQFLPASARDAVQAVVDLTRGVQAMQAGGAAGGAAGLAMQIGGAAGVVGAVFQLGKGLLDASDRAREEAQRAREQLQASITDFVYPLRGVAGEVREAADLLDQLAGGTAFRANFARTLGSATEALDFLARQAATLSSSRAGDVVAALARRIDEARASFSQELEARRLAVEFGDEAAAQYRRQIELERQLAEARLLGIEESLVREVFAAEERKRLADEAERLTRDEERRLQEIADARRSFLEDLSRREAFTAGTGAQFDAADAFRRAVEAADEALASGAITQEEYARAVAQAAAEQADALRAIEDAAERAAEAIARQNDALESEISLRTLVLEGKDAEAAALRREIQFREELRRAIEAGLDETLIERLRELQDRERQAAADARAVEDLVRSVGRQAERDQQQFVRASVQSITATQADTLTELTRGSNTYLREISLNTAGLRGAGTVGASGGTRIEVRVTQQFYGPVTNAQQVGANTARQIAEEVDRALGQAQREAQRLGQGVGG